MKKKNGIYEGFLTLSRALNGPYTTRDPPRVSSCSQHWGTMTQPELRESCPHAPCCKLKLDKKLKLDPRASFRDTQQGI